MSDWTEWDVNSLLPGEPWTSAKAIAAFENVNAAFEGAADAPRVYLRALEQLEAGDEIRSRFDSEQSGNTSSHSFSFIQSGEIRCTFEAKDAGGALSSGVITRTRNGSETTLVSEGLTGFVYNTITADISVLPGDTIKMKLSPGAGASLTLRNARFSTDGQDLWPGVGVRLEGNRSAT